MEKEIAVEAEYKGDLMRKVEQVLEETLPDYTRYKVVIIKVIELK